ncbi:hypothetical protein [Streptomyces sp. UNOC14_S4]|uniref:hypothetical protein n=1 Tax=Streptomyces sp. UNOC14_S4 TaxID=2872340 RepID=UPI001E547850|nr:hypothetical protein [Streptomyces sp. UNOC14_S4]MCC3765993.1 hypothetical protein [Streptomyces sp. UNOC14_S4]
MKLYLAGTEFPTYRRLLAAEGHTDVALSYTGLRKRRKLDKPLRLDEQFEDRAQILLDSGAYSLSSDLLPAELRAMADSYYTNLVAPNLERIEFFTEFDAQSLGAEEREGWRTWMATRKDKAVVVWHPGQDLAELSAHWPNIAIPKDELDDHLVRRLKALLQEHDIRLFGLGITKPGVMERVAFHGVTSTSWLSPAQYGDTIWYSGGELRRYPKKMKERARARHRQELAAAGLDVDLIDADDSTELLRASIYAWSQYMDKLNARSRGVSTSVETPSHENADLVPQTVDTQALEERHGEVTPLPAWRREEPIRVRTKEQLADAEASILELQLGRVYKRARQEESYQDGELDPVLSEEIDRFSTLIAKKRKADETSFSISIKASQKGEAQTGLISRLFGREDDTQAKALPAPAEAPQQKDIVEAEIVDEHAA